MSYSVHKVCSNGRVENRGSCHSWKSPEVAESLSKRVQSGSKSPQGNLWSYDSAPGISAVRWPQWLSKLGLTRLIPRVYLLGQAGMSGKGRAKPGAQLATEGPLKLLGPTEELCLESEFTCNRKGVDRGQSLWARAKIGISKSKPNTRKNNLSSEKYKEHLASGSRYMTNSVSLHRQVTPN